jgi:hypothetical protein
VIPRRARIAVARQHSTGCCEGRPDDTPVIFGERGDSTLLGAVTLEALGVILDPIKRKLRPLPMIVAEE